MAMLNKLNDALRVPLESEADHAADDAAEGLTSSDTCCEVTAAEGGLPFTLSAILRIKGARAASSE